MDVQIQIWSESSRRTPGLEGLQGLPCTGTLSMGADRDLHVSASVAKRAKQRLKRLRLLATVKHSAVRD